MSDLHAHLSRRLAAGHAAPRTDLLSDSRFADAARTADAAVLIAVTEGAEPGVLLTRRPPTMRDHPGQVAFPGGKLDSGEDAIAAALREAREELGIAAQDIRVIGATDRYQTGTGFDITPVLATVPAGLAIAPDPREVESWFEAPLALLLERANWRWNSVFWKGAQRDYLEMDYAGYRIWGVTAAICWNLSLRLGEERA